MGSLEEEKRRRETEEVERLRNILKKFGARERLNRIKEKVWKEGHIEELAGGWKWLNGLYSAELRLVTNYVYLDRRDGRTDLHDLLYPNDAGGVHYHLGYSDRVAVLTVGASNATSMGDVKVGLEDYVHVGFRTVGLERWNRHESKNFVLYKGNRSIKIDASSADLKVSQFINRNLIELTGGEFLPNTLRHHNRPRLM